jgi:hypothetical protein
VAAGAVANSHVTTNEYPIRAATNIAPAIIQRRDDTLPARPAIQATMIDTIAAIARTT